VKAVGIGRGVEMGGGSVVVIGVFVGATVAGNSVAAAAVGSEAARVAATPAATSVWKVEGSAVGVVVKVLQARRVMVRRMRGRRRWGMRVFYIGVRDASENRYAY
jgi:hypothetical protein